MAENLRFTSVLYHLPSVGPKQLCALVHLGCTPKVGRYFLVWILIDFISILQAFNTWGQLLWKIVKISNKMDWKWLWKRIAFIKKIYHFFPKTIYFLTVLLMKVVCISFDTTKKKLYIWYFPNFQRRIYWFNEG